MDMIDRLIAREGGDKLTNIWGDPGGVTKYGISQRAYPARDIAALTLEQAKDIYIQDYYLKYNLQLLPEPLQEPMLDWCVHSGPAEPIKTLQRLVGATPDGTIGPKTATLASAGPLLGMVQALALQRLLSMIRQVEANPIKLKFLRGWVTRVFGLL